jgi:predicted PurR-regulated permease PerM
MFISGPVEAVQRFLQNAESYVQVMSSQNITTNAASASAPSELSNILFAGTASFASGLLTTILVLFFLLVSGDLFLRRLVEVLPRFRDKRTAVQISNQIENDIAVYLITVTVMNALVGIATTLVLWAVGIGNPLLWGVFAFLLNYIPIIGPIINLVLLMLAGLLTMDSLFHAFMPAAGFMVIHIVEGQFVTPMLLARRFTLNPVVVIISLIFWYWMWGVPGAILAVPVLGIIKIVCDSIGPWAAIGHLIEG